MMIVLLSFLYVGQNVRWFMLVVQFAVTKKHPKSIGLHWNVLPYYFSFWLQYSLCALSSGYDKENVIDAELWPFFMSALLGQYQSLYSLITNNSFDNGNLSTIALFFHCVDMCNDVFPPSNISMGIQLYYNHILCLYLHPGWVNGSVTIKSIFGLKSSCLEFVLWSSQ